jgi:outer membrane protein assembly factor BamD (BamD/ComL family)
MKKNRVRFAFFLFLILALYLPLNGFASEITIRSEDQLDLAREAYERGEYTRAIVELERLIQFFPEDPEVPRARYLVGLSHLKARNYEAARKRFEEVIHLYPFTPIAGQSQLMLAESYYLQGAYEEAERIYRQIITEQPNSELSNRALYGLGWTLMQRGVWKEASENFGEVQKTSPLFRHSSDLSRRSLLGEELPSKDPTTAGVLAALVPGLGHAYTERYKDGLVAFLLNGLFIWAAYESFHKDLNVLGGILGFLELGWYSGNIYSAVNSAHKYNRAAQNDFLRRLKEGSDVGLFSTSERGIGLALQTRF